MIQTETVASKMPIIEMIDEEQFDFSNSLKKKQKNTMSSSTSNDITTTKTANQQKSKTTTTAAASLTKAPKKSFISSMVAKQLNKTKK